MPKGPTPLRPNRGRKQDKAYVEWLHRQPCIVCQHEGCRQNSRTEVHHEYNATKDGGGSYAKRPDDSRGIPLCWAHGSRLSPTSVHSIGKAFWPSHGLAPEAIIERLQERYRQERQSN